MSNDLQSYLASKYMSGPKADAILASSSKKVEKKKKNRNSTSTSQKNNEQSSLKGINYSGLILRDEDEVGGWKATVDDDESTPVVENIENFKAKSVKESKWSVIKPSETLNDEAFKNETKAEEEDEFLPDEKPQIVETEEYSRTVKGGLQTASQIKDHLKYQDMKLKKRRSPSQEPIEEETIYRDSQGRKIDTKQMRAEEKRRRAKDLEKQMKKMEWGKGLVQRDDKKADADELKKIASQPFARTIDDDEMNKEMKDKQRWNDPAAAFLTKSSKTSNTSSRPKYQGPPPPPNRYAIPPGFRWDGVDRSNGFENKFFQADNDRKRLRAEAYSYSVDEM